MSEAPLPPFEDAARRAPVPVSSDLAGDPIPIGSSGKRGNRALVVVSVVAAIEALVIAGLVLVIVAMSVADVLTSDSVGFTDGVSRDDSLRYDDACTELADAIRPYLETGDVEGYLGMYAAGDEHVDLSYAEREFESVSGKLQDRGGEFDLVVQPTTIYEDRDTGETLVKVYVQAWEPDDPWTPSPLTSFSTFMLVAQEDGPGPEYVALTGKTGRDVIEMGEADPYYW